MSFDVNDVAQLNITADPCSMLCEGECTWYTAWAICCLRTRGKQEGRECALRTRWLPVIATGGCDRSSAYRCSVV